MSDEKSSTLPRLWESDHPYYCAEGCFYKNGCHLEWSSWSDFADQFSDADLDLNHVWRWDWKGPRSNPDRTGPDELTVYMMAQRKAAPSSHSIAVTDDDEPRVRLFLQQHWERVQENWSPFHADSGEAAQGIAEELRQQRIARLRAELVSLEAAPVQP